MNGPSYIGLFQEMENRPPKMGENIFAGDNSFVRINNNRAYIRCRAMYEPPNKPYYEVTKKGFEIELTMEAYLGLIGKFPNQPIVKLLPGRVLRVNEQNYAYFV